MNATRHSTRPTRRRNVGGCAALFSLGLLAFGCGDGASSIPGSSGSVVSPQPLPVDAPVLSFSTPLLSVSHSSKATTLSGATGAAPGGDELWVFAVDVPGASDHVASDADGSFTATFATKAASVFHLEAEQDGVIGGLTDVEETSSGGLAPAATPKCISANVTSPLIEESAANMVSTFSLSLKDTCGVEQSVGVALHDGVTFTLRGAATSIAAHGSVALEITHDATTTPGEDVDLLVVTDASGAHLIVSLHAITSSGS